MGRGPTFVAVVLFVALAASTCAQPLPPDVTNGEFNCMRATAEASSLAVKKRIACVIRCAKSFYRGKALAGDCVAPYGGKTLECITRVKGPEWRMTEAIGACGINGCPACYESGDCSASGAGGTKTAMLGAMVDSFGAVFMCEDASATRVEQQCLRKTMKEFPRMVADVAECIDQCALIARRGSLPYSECFVGTGNFVTQCIAAGAAAHAERIDRTCAPIQGSPDFCGGGLPDGAGWSNLTTVGFGSYFTIDTYCGD